MSQRGAWDFDQVHHITESQFGSTPTTGTWLPVHRVKRFEATPMFVKRPKVGIGRQNPSDWEKTKDLYEYTIEVELVKKETSPAYDPYTFVQYIIEKASGADGVPDNALESFSLCARANITTDEFFWLKGCMHDKVELIGREVSDRVTARFHGLAQWGDYGTTDPVSGTATRQALPATDDTIEFGDCDVLYDPTTPASILSRLESWRLSLSREIVPRGLNATTTTLYREFVPRSRTWEAEISLDFDSRTEYEHFIDMTKTKITFEIPNAVGGSIFALTSGYWNPGRSGLPVGELDLLNVSLIGEWATLARSAHG